MKQPVVIKPDDLEKESIFVSFPGFSNIPVLFATGARCAINRIIPPEMECYKKGFDIVMKSLHYGNSFLTNYTCQTEIDLTSSFRDSFANARAKYKILFKDKWVCFSPETFVQIKDGMIYSFPMKGTINGEIPNAEQVILNDEKEIGEHYTIVDLIRNDLGMVASDVSVERFRYTEKVETYKGVLWQVSSEIRGRLPEKFHHNLGDILFALLPAGSVSGAPKAKTLDVIREAENYQRGYYCGVVFYFDGENVDSCVLIRFIERIGDKIYYKSGGGITVYSNLQKEYQEVLDKIYVPIY